MRTISRLTNHAEATINYRHSSRHGHSRADRAYPAAGQYGCERPRIVRRGFYRVRGGVCVRKTAARQVRRAVR
jgi:hypothetical protein